MANPTAAGPIPKNEHLNRRREFMAVDPFQRDFRNENMGGRSGCEIINEAPCPHALLGQIVPTVFMSVKRRRVKRKEKGARREAEPGGGSHPLRRYWRRNWKLDWVAPEV